MNIALVGYKDTPVSIFSELGKSLSSKISGLEIVARYAPVPEDLPAIALECAAESDFVFVFALVDDEELAVFIKRKLIDVELASKTRILKAVELDDVSGLSEELYYAKKDELVEEYSRRIVDVLFNERGFEPKEKDFTM
jgi:hypothetical protein